MGLIQTLTTLPYNRHSFVNLIGSGKNFISILTIDERYRLKTQLIDSLDKGRKLLCSLINLRTLSTLNYLIMILVTPKVVNFALLQLLFLNMFDNVWMRARRSLYRDCTRLYFSFLSPYSYPVRRVALKSLIFAYLSA